MNILFYIFIKIKSDKAIQKYSIVYSGVFMERLTIYRKLLEEIFDLKVSLSEHIQEDKEETEELLKKFNSFIKCCKINEPLLSDSLSKNLQKLDKEFRLITQDALRAVNSNTEKQAERDFAEIMKNAQEKKELLQKIYKNDLLKAVENNLINDMKADFSAK
jgi:hypothetical protein